MNRPCVALSLLLASLATVTFAVSKARCQSADWSDEANYGCPLYEGDWLGLAPEDRLENSKAPEPETAEAPSLAGAEEYDNVVENDNDASGYEYDDYEYDDYTYGEYGYDDYGYEYPYEDPQPNESSSESPAEVNAAEDVAAEDVAAEEIAAEEISAEETPAEETADNEPAKSYEYEAYRDDELDPEYEYADDYAPYDYENGLDENSYEIEDSYEADDPALAVEADGVEADGAEPADEADAAYDYHADYDPVYDEVMFGDNSDADDVDAEDVDVETADEVPAADQEAIEDQEVNTAHPQSWDDYNYDSGYDYENPYEDWYEDVVRVPAAEREESPESEEASVEESQDESEDSYDDYAGEWYDYNEAQFEEAYREYWNDDSTTTKDSTAQDTAAKKIEAPASRSDWEDCYGDCWFDYGHAGAADEAKREAAASAGEPCATLATEARNAVLLLMASALDHVGGALQDASYDLTRMAQGESSSQSR